MASLQYPREASEMPRCWTDEIRLKDNVLGWIAIAAGFIAAIVLDKGSPPHKWHAAIEWTIVAPYGVLILGRRSWKSWRFWIFWTICLILHVFAMWVIFDQLLPRLILGTLYVVPIAFIESIFLVGMFARLDANWFTIDTGNHDWWVAHPAFFARAGKFQLRCQRQRAERHIQHLHLGCGRQECLDHLLHDQWASVYVRLRCLRTQSGVVE
jgi:hypothetical protein